jgi:branched-chain amino acid transport system substrate-binding protein
MTTANDSKGLGTMIGINRRLWVQVAVATCGILVIAACGQKPGVSEQSAAAIGTQLSLPEGTALDEEGNLVDVETGEVIATAEELAEGGVDLGSGGSGPADSDLGDSGTGPDPSAPQGGTSPSASGDSTGVTDDVVKIGVHAPITGAAPVPSDSAHKGTQLYWRWLEEKGEKIFGRRVEVILKNDNYNPSQAVAVCREMVEQDKVFLLSGAAGTDQIQACARYAASVGVPYLGAGVTELGLDNLRNYFATSMSYPAQQTLIAQLLKNRLGASNEKNGIVWFNTATFKDGHDAFIKTMKQHGLSVDYDRAVSKTAGASEAQTIATELNQQGIDNVNVLMAPVFFLQMLNAAGTQGYQPQWVGAGIQMTFDTVAQVGCRNGALDGAKMFSPFPGWVDSNKFDPNFRKAVQQIYPEKREGDDFMWLGWSGSKTFHEMLKKAGPTPTREAFILMLEGSKFFNGIGPHLSFTETDHFGADEVHLSEAKCGQDQRWHTIDTWMKRF